MGQIITISLIYIMTAFVFIYYVINIIFNIMGRKTKCPKCNVGYNRKEWNLPTKRLGKLTHKQKESIAKVYKKLVEENDTDFLDLISEK